MFLFPSIDVITFINVTIHYISICFYILFLPICSYIFLYVPTNILIYIYKSILICLLIYMFLYLCSTASWLVAYPAVLWSLPPAVGPPGPHLPGGQGAAGGGPGGRRRAPLQWPDTSAKVGEDGGNGPGPFLIPRGSLLRRFWRRDECTVADHGGCKPASNFPPPPSTIIVEGVQKKGEVTRYNPLKYSPE